MSPPRPLRASQPVKALLTVSVVLSGITIALADDDGRDFDRADFRPGNLLLSRVVYDNNASNIAAGVQLPPNCVGSNCVTATDNGAYPNVWNNDLVDASFGITAKILLDQLRPSGAFVSSLEVPNSSQRRIGPDKDQMVTSFSSKSDRSRLALIWLTLPGAITTTTETIVRPVECYRALISRSATLLFRRATPSVLRRRLRASPLIVVGASALHNHDHSP